MTVPAPFLNFLPGFSHSALPLRAVLWMTSLKAFICLRGKWLLTHPLWESEFTFQRNLFFSVLLCQSLWNFLHALVGCSFGPPPGRETHVPAHLSKIMGDFQALMAHFSHNFFHRTRWVSVSFCWKLFQSCTNFFLCRVASPPSVSWFFSLTPWILVANKILDSDPFPIACLYLSSLGPREWHEAEAGKG